MLNRVRVNKLMIMLMLKEEESQKKFIWELLEWMNFFLSKRFADMTLDIIKIKNLLMGQ